MCENLHARCTRKCWIVRIFGCVGLRPWPWSSYEVFKACSDLALKYKLLKCTNYEICENIFEILHTDNESCGWCVNEKMRFLYFVGFPRSMLTWRLQWMKITLRVIRWSQAWGLGRALTNALRKVLDFWWRKQCCQVINFCGCRFQLAFQFHRDDQNSRLQNSRTRLKFSHNLYNFFRKIIRADPCFSISFWLRSRKMLEKLKKRTTVPVWWVTNWYLKKWTIFIFFKN